MAPLYRISRECWQEVCSYQCLEILQCGKIQKNSAIDFTALCITMTTNLPHDYNLLAVVNMDAVRLIVASASVVILDISAEHVGMS